MIDHLVYDTETTDVDVHHGQIVQFASIRADSDFNTVSEDDIRIRRLPYVVPAPEAMEVTGLDPAELDAPDRPTEYEASGQIEKLLRPRYGLDQINITFNGAKFDDELLRMMLYRNLRNPWFYSSPSIRRVDLLPLARLMHTINAATITVPTKEDGRPSWKLADLCTANGIDILAHDALEDVRGTLALAHMMKSRAPSLWAEGVNCGHAFKAEQQLRDQMARGTPAWLFTYFGKPELIPCAVLANDRRKKWILLDLRAEPGPVMARDISTSLYTAESPYRVVRSNAAQLLVSDVVARSLIGEHEVDSMRRAAEAVRANASLREEAGKALTLTSFEMPLSPTSEERIYDGFFQDPDHARMRRFHSARWAERSSMEFDDGRLSDFAARIVIEAVINGQAPEVHGDLFETLLERCREAYARPCASADSRWMSIAKGRASTPSDSWSSWADGAVGKMVVSQAQPDQPHPVAGQFSFGF